MYVIYGKYKNEKTYKPMDVREGKQTRLLFYATMFEHEEALRVCNELTTQNSDWKFQVRDRG